MFKASTARRNVHDYEDVLRKKAKQIWEVTQGPILGIIGDKIESESMLGLKSFAFSVNYVSASEIIKEALYENNFTIIEMQTDWNFVQEFLIKELISSGYDVDTSVDIKITWDK